jgi:putative ABC transport system ATP-binding protein
MVGVALMTALEIKNLKFRYSSQAENVLNIPQFSVSRGEKLFMYGPSGSGKTTLLSLVGGLFNPNSGSIAVLGKDIFALSSTARDHFRAQNIGFVFQVFNLLPYLTVIDNVLLPCQFGRQKTASFASEQEEARYLLAQLGLEDYLNSSVSKLSIGQQQRVAAARALIGSPGLIIADAYDAEIAQPAALVPLAPARRKTETQRLARLAMRRLMGISDPDSALSGFEFE